MTRERLSQLEHHDAFLERHIGPNDAEIAHMLGVVGHDSLEAMRKQYGLKAIDAVVVSHMHGDHFLQAPHLREKWGAKIWALENMVEKMEHPERFDYPAPIQAYGDGTSGSVVVFPGGNAGSAQSLPAGNGTFGVAITRDGRLVAQRPVPVLGVNLGSLGVLVGGQWVRDELAWDDRRGRRGGATDAGVLRARGDGRRCAASLPLHERGSSGRSLLPLGRRCRRLVDAGFAG